MIILNTTPLTPAVFKPITISMTFDSAAELRMMKDFVDYRTTVANAVYFAVSGNHRFVFELLANISKELK